MREESPQKRPSGGLAACGGCYGVFPASRLVTVGNVTLCSACNRAFGPDATPGAAYGGTSDDAVAEAPRSPEPAAPPPPPLPPLTQPRIVASRAVAVRLGETGEAAPLPPLRPGEVPPSRTANPYDRVQRSVGVERPVPARPAAAEWQGSWGRPPADEAAPLRSARPAPASEEPAAAIDEIFRDPYAAEAGEEAPRRSSRVSGDAESEESPAAPRVRPQGNPYGMPASSALGEPASESPRSGEGNELPRPHILRSRVLPPRIEESAPPVVGDDGELHDAPQPRSRDRVLEPPERTAPGASQGGAGGGGGGGGGANIPGFRVSRFGADWTNPASSPAQAPAASGAPAGSPHASQHGSPYGSAHGSAHGSMHGVSGGASGASPAPAAPAAPRPIPGFPHLNPAPAAADGGVAVADDPDAAQGLVPRRVEGRTALKEGFAQYAELRKRIDRGDDSLELRKDAGELACRLGLQLEAIEHFKRCVDLAPQEERYRNLLDNVRRSVGAERGGVEAPPQDAERRVPEEARPFWEELGEAVRYPLRGRGKAVLLVGGCVLAGAELIASVNLFSAVISCLVAGYCASFLFDVMNTTGAGRKDPPEMPEMTSILDTYVFPLISLVACAMAGFLPFSLVVYAAVKGWLPTPVAVPLALATFALGAFVFPMTLLVRGMFQTWTEPLNVKLVFGSIGRIFPDYVAAYIASSLLWVGFGIAKALVFVSLFFTLGLPTPDAVLALDVPRLVAWCLYTVLTWPLFLYVWVLQGHLLGRLYRQGLRRLAWFVAPTAQTQRARTMSGALWAAAIGATLLLCGAGWAVSKMWTVTAGNAGGAALLASCPVKAGSRLAYYWESTDGQAGITTYAFEGAANGRLRVLAQVRLAHRQEEPGPVEEVGHMDPSTGIFTDAGGAWGPGIHFDGRRGEHVPYYGPARSAIGTTYLNTWTVRGAERWQKTWSTWKVEATDPARATAVHYYDTRNGVLVGRFYSGVGYQVTEWLVAAKDVAGVVPGPAPNYDFSALPLDHLGAGKQFDVEIPPVGPNELFGPGR